MLWHRVYFCFLILKMKKYILNTHILFFITLLFYSFIHVDIISICYTTILMGTVPYFRNSILSSRLCKKTLHKVTVEHQCLQTAHTTQLELQKQEQLQQADLKVGQFPSLHPVFFFFFFYLQTVSNPQDLRATPTFRSHEKA